MSKKAIKTKEYKRIIEYMNNDKGLRETTKNKYLKAFTFLYFTGCRINEVCKLKGEDIRTIIKDKKVKLLMSKTARFKGQEFRTIEFSDKAVNQIKLYFSDCLQHPDGYCLRAWNNQYKSLNIISFTNALNSYIKKALGDADYGTHSFRRGILTEMIVDNNVVPEVAQLFIGHKNYSTTAQYVKATQQDVRNSLVR